MLPLHLYPVQRVIDGDTFVSGRNRDGSESSVRLYGVETPERGEHCFEEATERFHKLAGDRVRIEFSTHGARTHTAVLCSMSIPRRGRRWRRS